MCCLNDNFLTNSTPNPSPLNHRVLYLLDFHHLPLSYTVIRFGIISEYLVRTHGVVEHIIDEQQNSGAS